jgi:hypothetical protein
MKNLFPILTVSIFFVNVSIAKKNTKKEGVVYSFERYPDEPQTTSRLNFTIDDFFDENGDYKYYDDEENLPWQDLSEMVTSLTKVKQLVYLFSKANDETGGFGHYYVYELQKIK